MFESETPGAKKAPTVVIATNGKPVSSVNEFKAVRLAKRGGRAHLTSYATGGRRTLLRRAREITQPTAENHPILIILSVLLPV